MDLRAATACPPLPSAFISRMRRENGTGRAPATVRRADAHRRGGGSAFLKWQWERIRHGVSPDPAPSALPTVAAAVARPRASAEELRVTWVGHSTLLLQFGGLNVLTDPAFSRRASPVQWAGPSRLTAPGLKLEDLPPLDAVLLSHDHFDHLDDGSVRRLARLWPEATWVTPTGYRAWLRRRGAEAVAECAWGDEAAVAGADGRMRFVALPAAHWCARSPFARNRRSWASWGLVTARGARFYFGGDSGYFRGYREIGRRWGPFDAAALPIGAYAPEWFMRPVHMNPEEAVRAYRELQVRGPLVAIHWGTFRLSDEPVLEPPARLRSAWGAAGLPESDLWIHAHGETRVLRIARAATDAGGAAGAPA